MHDAAHSEHTDMYLTKLERQVERLIAVCEEQAATLETLRQRLAEAEAARDQLHHKNAQARERIEALVERLKTQDQ